MNISKPDKPVTLLSVFPGFGIGGAQVRFSAVANHFGGKYRHLIVSLDGADDCKSRLDPGLDVTFLKIENSKQKVLQNRARFRALLRRVRPEMLITHNWGSMDWCLANLPRLVAHVHIEDGFGPEEAHQQLLRRSLTRRIVLRRSLVVVPSLRLQSIALDIWKLPPAGVLYIPNGVDTARFSSASAPSNNAIPVIGTIAALRQEKNLPRLLEAFRLVLDQRQCRFVIAGDGPERGFLETYAAKLGLADAVVFTGYRQDTERVYASLDVFAMSSDTEQMPTSVLEAMAAGLPIVSTGVGDVRNMVSLENSSFIVRSDATELANAISRLLDHPALAKTAGIANQHKVQNEFSQERMFASYARLFDGHSGC